MIKHEGSKWVLYSADGSKKLDEFNTKDDALKREQQIQFFKHKGESDRTTEKHSAAWERCVQQVKAQGGKYNPYAVCTASLGGAAFESETRARQPEAIVMLTLEQAQAADVSLADQMRTRGVTALRINTDTWDIEEVVNQPEAIRRTREYCESAIAPVQAGPDFTGREWDVTIIGPKTPQDLVIIGGREYVRSRNGRYYACEALARSVPLWEGVKVYDNHLTDVEFAQRQGMRALGNEWAGVLVTPRWDEADRRLCATLKVVDEPLAKKFAAAWQANVLHTVGLSIDTKPVTREAMVEGKRLPLIEGFKEIYSVDLVAEPAAGGGFNRLIQSLTEETDMELTPEVIELIKAEIAKALAGNQAQPPAQEQTGPPDLQQMTAAGIAAADVGTAAIAGAQQVGAIAQPDADPAKVAQAAADAAAQAAQDKADQIEQALKTIECRLLLKDKLEAVRLPESLRRLVEAQFAGKIFKEVELDKYIKDVKEAVAPLDASGRVTGLGGAAGVSVGLAPQDKMQMEFLRLVAGNEGCRALEHAKADYVRDRLPEAYSGWIKAGRPNYGTRRISEWVYEILGGDPFGSQRAYEAVTTSSMTSIVKNTVNILLAADYAKRHLWWEPIVRIEEVDTIDTATLARVYGLNTLSVVEEGQAYTELPWADEEETAAFVKKGNYVGITLETLLSDKLNVVRSLPERLATAWYNTLSALVAAVFTTNTAAGPVLADTGALFNATAVTSAGGHANLLTAALSLTAFSAARTAMMKQTDQVLGAGQKLLIQPKFLLVPADLETTALQIRNSEQIPGSANNDINPFYQKFEVIVVPNWTDANDWALVADPGEFPAIWQIFLTGKRVPELFTADSEVAGAMFTNDTLRYKARMLTFRFSSSYDCSPVADFRGLHKNNC
jgi:hypothetical protein